MLLVNIVGLIIILVDYRNNISLKDLGIKYEDVILKFISEGLLPKNYLSLKIWEKYLQRCQE